MYSIKDSFSNCSACDLFDAPSCILDTNCKKDLSQVDVVFIAENPGKDEIKKEIPLVGKAGQMFRKYFKKYDIDKMKYLLTNTVLCQTLLPDGKTGNPTSEVINLCKENCMNIIKICNPKLVALMGGSPMEAFGFGKGGITVKHQSFLEGSLEEWEGYPVAIMVHPSFVNRQSETWEPKYEAAMARVSSMLSGKATEFQVKSETKSIGKGIFRYKIPEKFYTDEYRLIDVQYLNKTSQVLYIFRDKDNNKVYHKESDNYICYQVPKDVPAKKMVPYDDLNQIQIKYRDRYNLDPQITYEGDVRITSKHAMDYYHYNQGEPTKTFNNVMYADIEIDTGDEKIFPKPIDALFPINMLTTIYNGVKTLYVIDNKTEPIQEIDGVNFKIFANEKSLLQTFIKDFKQTDPDFISGWNLINFDLFYIFTRLPLIGIPQGSISKFGEFYVDGSKYVCNLSGCVAIDQDYVYRTFTFTKMENYKLGFIAQEELGITKIQLPLSFNEMYWKMLNKTIEYNIRDTELLEKLDTKLAHINLLNELRIICNTSFDSVSSFGQIDSLMVSYLRNKGIASKNSDPHIAKEDYPGAFVFQPTPGVYDYITDFDFASLYPSLMITYNIGVNSFIMKTEDPTDGYDITYHPENLPDKVNMIIDPLYEKKVVQLDKKELFKFIQEKNLVHTINGCFFKPHEKEFSSFGQVVDMLMTSRKDYKEKMFKEKDESAEYKYFYTRQLVYKVLANTLYGVVANKSFRFFDTSLASAVTLSGQEALKTSIIYGDAFMRSIAKGTEIEEPKPLTKLEMFSSDMPDRSNEYIVTGDTDSIFCCFEKVPLNNPIIDINNWCLQIEKYLNEDKILEVVKKHNVNLQFNRLKLKNELLISRGLFLAKKRYVIRVIMNEGKEVDKINFMGIEIKRSDYPSKSKEFMRELSDLILRSERVSLTKLLKYVQEQEKGFVDAIESGSKTVARPVSWGKEIKNYKLVPQGVKAMQAWNDIMYPIHKTGVKAYMFWVRGIDIEKAPEDVIKKYHAYVKAGNGKLEVIAIPDDEEKLPNYFIPNRDAALKFVFRDRYELMLKPLTDAQLMKQKATILTF